ncbi:LysR family transcriptional regulator [Burkholderia sp. WAC0059]|uniref:LysR family transcriptional regulator n=1 Tax=Burkholderia sp. WAC0059 TaxID=2066022 RepID=UPI000C7E88EB|nr:LysR family transcriptional regulator [Burkholderia sp. WAC0059]PLZ03900.1 LysR family transcriptional regulator [Burkholderia sp. WAC0059]
MREISLDRLRTLVTIADNGSFAEAARILHLAPPTVSLHVQELEDRIGAPLLSRKRGNIRPTSVGEALLFRARRLLAETEQALDDLQRQVQGLEGRVRLGASTGVLAHLLPQALEVLARQHPSIDVQVAVLTSQDTLTGLADGALDIGLVALPQPAVAGLVIKPWRRDPIRAFLPATWQCPTFVTPKWLAGRPLILNDSTTRLSRLTAEWFARAGERPEARIELNYNDAIRSLVAAGYGAALLPQESDRPPAQEARVITRALRPAMWRQLGIAHVAQVDRSTQYALDVLWSLR